MLLNEKNLAIIRSMQERITTLKEEVDRAKGAMSQIKKELKKEFKCNTIKEAKELLKQMEADQEELVEQFEQEAKLFEARYKTVFSGSEKD